MDGYEVDYGSDVPDVGDAAHDTALDIVLDAKSLVGGGGGGGGGLLSLSAGDAKSLFGGGLDGRGAFGKDTATTLTFATQGTFGTFGTFRRGVGAGAGAGASVDAEDTGASVVHFQTPTKPADRTVFSPVADVNAMWSSLRSIRVWDGVTRATFADLSLFVLHADRGDSARLGVTGLVTRNKDEPPEEGEVWDEEGPRVESWAQLHDVLGSVWWVAQVETTNLASPIPFKDRSVDLARVITHEVRTLDALPLAFLCACVADVEPSLATTLPLDSPK